MDEDDPERRLALLALVLAHETKNALNPLGLQIALLRRRLASDPSLAGLLDAMATAVARADWVLCAAQRMAHELAPDVTRVCRDFDALASALRPPESEPEAAADDEPSRVP